jgi:hypothetical protein
MERVGSHGDICSAGAGTVRAVVLFVVTHIALGVALAGCAELAQSDDQRAESGADPSASPGLTLAATKQLQESIWGRQGTRTS